MKNKFISRLLSSVAIMVLLYSCRNELSPEQETYSNSSQFRPTSKTIRLEESKHKLVLKNELQKAQENLTEIKTNASGKTVDFANGVSIDTDNVTYIEVGPTFHTYTFNLVRENAPENAPVENLVLASLPDGSYKELLVTYNFTPQEKQDLLAGKGVKTKGKATAMELAKGTYGGVISNSMGTVESCSYQTVDMYFSCYTGRHNETNESTWGGCEWESEGGYPAQHITTVALVCTATTALGDDGSPGGGELGPTTGLGSGSNEGTPTIPTFTLPKHTPCGKTKSLLANTDVQAKITELKNQSTLGGEKGVKFKLDGTPSETIIGGTHSVNFGDKTGYAGGYHNHTPTGISMLSPPDVEQLLQFALAQGNYGNPANAYIGMVAPNGMHYVAIFNGNYDDALKSFSQQELDGFTKNFETRNYLYQSSNTPEGLEKLFFKTLSDMNLDGKINLQRIEGNGTIKTITKDNNGIITATPCP